MNNDFMNPSEENFSENNNEQFAPAPETTPVPSEETVYAPAQTKDNIPEGTSVVETPVAETPVPFTAEAEPEFKNEAPAQPPYTAPVYTQPVPTAEPQNTVSYTAQSPYTMPQSTPQASPHTAPNQYGYYNPQGYTPQPPEKKKKGATAFLIILWVIIGTFALGFFVLCGYVAGQHVSDGDTAPTLFSEETKPDDKNDDFDSDTPANNNPNGAIPQDDSAEIYTNKQSLTLHSLPPDKGNTDKYTTQYAFKKVSDSTVGIVCYNGEMTVESEVASQGTGIILTKDGYVATNSHVIGDSRSAYTVQVVTGDGTTYEASVIGFDSRTDLAVLKINAKNLTPAEFCDSELVEVGQDVIAVGNPGGIDFQNSLTRGVVSALNRELDLSSQVTYIQTDAAINPGNSGGPLCNMYGQVIGINTAKISDSSYEGMGFAIPSQTVKNIVDDLMKQGYVSDRVRLGISGQAVTSTMAQYYNVPEGILVNTISEGGPCDGTDLQMNDIITAIDGEDIASFKDVYAILAEHKPGDKVTLSVYRMDTNRTFEINVTLMADEGETQQ